MSGSQPRFTPNIAKVLDMLIANPNSAGADISRETGLKSGSLYPILMRLEDAGWLASEWEAGDPATLGRPRRRFYVVTGTGRAQANMHAREQRAILGRLAW